MLRVDDRLRDWVKHLISQPTLVHSQDTPDSRFGAMLLAQSGWKRFFVKNGRALVSSHCAHNYRTALVVPPRKSVLGLQEFCFRYA